MLRFTENPKQAVPITKLTAIHDIPDAFSADVSLGVRSQDGKRVDIFEIKRVEGEMVFFLRSVIHHLTGQSVRVPLDRTHEVDPNDPEKFIARQNEISMTSEEFRVHLVDMLTSANGNSESERQPLTDDTAA